MAICFTISYRRNGYSTFACVSPGRGGANSGASAVAWPPSQSVRIAKPRAVGLRRAVAFRVWTTSFMASLPSAIRDRADYIAICAEGSSIEEGVQHRGRKGPESTEVYREGGGAARCGRVWQLDYDSPAMRASHSRESSGFAFRVRSTMKRTAGSTAGAGLADRSQSFASVGERLNQVP